MIPSFLKTAAFDLALSDIARAYNYSTVSEHCNDIWSFTSDAGLEAPTAVTNVTLVPANGTTPAYCSVAMTVDAYTGVVMYLPAEGKDWKAYFLHTAVGVPVVYLGSIMHTETELDHMRLNCWRGDMLQV
jgi:hypothetical protein